MFALETDRLQGRLSEAEFAEQKAALEVVLRRALARGDGPSEGSRFQAIAIEAGYTNSVESFAVAGDGAVGGGLCFFAFVVAPVAFHSLSECA